MRGEEETAPATRTRPRMQQVLNTKANSAHRLRHEAEGHRVEMNNARTTGENSGFNRKRRPDAAAIQRERA